MLYRRNNMETMRYLDILEKNKALPAIGRKVLVVRNRNTEPLFADYLHYCGITSHPFFCDEKAAMLINDSYEVAIVLLDLSYLAGDFYHQFYLLEQPQIEQGFAFWEETLARLLAHLKSISQKLYFVSFLPEANGFRPICGISWNDITQKLNESMKKNLTNTGGQFIDLQPLLLSYGENALYNKRSNQHLICKYTPCFFENITNVLYREIEYPPIKCLVLDCDGVLWGGIVGEDGPEGIKLSEDEGFYFRRFQREVSRLAKEGTIICLCSKNDEEAVLSIFRTHPEMILDLADISAYEISWDNKADGIRRLAASLNISLEQMLLIDDSIHEINLVKKLLPNIQVQHFDSSHPEEYVDLLLQHNFLQSDATEEDQTRTRSYQQNAARKQKIQSFQTPEEFNAYYHTICDIALMNKATIDRVAQLSQRSNQYNLSAARYSREELARMIALNEHEIFTLRVRDDFGDLGIVGAAALHYANDLVVIESFIFSCRAMGRGLEDQFLQYLLDHAAQRSISNISAQICPTSKNKKNLGLFEKHGVSTQKVRGKFA